MTKDEAFQQYEEEIAAIEKQAREASEVARNTLRERLKSLREEHHRALKEIRVLAQRVKGSNSNV